ncbi:MAG TPA: glycosyltransferase family 2 protein [Terriglobales bacterium]|jgi:glycosyltransferase involved in cell wall biosynthesis
MHNCAASASLFSETELRASNVGEPYSVPAITLPISIIIPTRNESRNLPRCLESVRGAGEVYVVDSESVDDTVEIARSFGAQVVQFQYRGGWPKKRQWALDHLPLKYQWVLLLDADESLTPAFINELQRVIRNPDLDGYYVRLELFFLGRGLRHGGASFYKLALFRRGKGRFECRSREQDISMCDMEVHEHVIVDGATGRLHSTIVHRNVDTLARYIQKHNEYSNWEMRVRGEGSESQDTIKPALFGSQAQRRRWLRKHFFHLPGSSLALFLYRYFLRLGFLDGVPGLIYCAFQAIQFFHVKAKLYEARIAAAEKPPLNELPTFEVSDVRY